MKNGDGIFEPLAAGAPTAPTPARVVRMACATAATSARERGHSSCRMRCKERAAAATVVLAALARCAGTGGGRRATLPLPPARLSEPEPAVDLEQPGWHGATWIGGNNQLRHEFQLPAGVSVQNATARVTGLGSFYLSANGVRVGDHVMDPGQTVADRRVLFVELDVAAMLLPGATNVLGVELGQYMYSAYDTYCNATELGPRGCLAFIICLSITLSDGTTQHIVSEAESGKWLARQGPIVFDQIYQGEIYDARIERGGWNSAALSSLDQSTEWSPAVAMQPNAGELTLSTIPPVRIVESFSATIVKRNANSTVFGFPRMMSGFCTLAVDPAWPVGLDPRGTFLVRTVCHDKPWSLDNHMKARTFLSRFRRSGRACSCATLSSMMTCVAM